MSTLDEAYKNLGLSPDASDEDVKKAYQKKAMAIPPDDPNAAVKIQLLNEAKVKIEEARRILQNNACTENQSQSTNQNTQSQNNNSSYNNSSYNNEENIKKSYPNHAVKTMHVKGKMPTNNVDTETPTEEHSTIAKSYFPWTTVLKWILFFPILIPIKIGKSKMGTLKKVILIYLSISLITWPVIFGLFEVLPKYIKEKTDTVITIDVKEMSNQLISGYNNYGCFIADEFCKTQNIKKDEYIIRVKKDSFVEDGTLFTVIIDKNDTIVGKATIKAIHPKLLSNGGVVDFEISEQIDGRYRIELTETTVYVSNLDDSEFIRHDPREHLKLVFSHKVTESFWTYNWNKIELSKSEYNIGDKTIRLSVIEDKRPGAEEVNPGLKFEVFDSNKKSIAVGEYIFAKMQYDANYDDYGQMYTKSFDLAPNFDQAEILTKTGILFIDTVSTYNF